MENGARACDGIAIRWVKKGLVPFGARDDGDDGVMNVNALGKEGRGEGATAATRVDAGCLSLSAYRPEEYYNN